jgi:hypothetical protein
VHAGRSSLYCMLRQPSTGPHPLPASVGFMDREVGGRLPSRACLLDLCESCPVCLLAFAFLVLIMVLGFPCAC